MPKYKVLIEDLKVDVPTTFKKDSEIILPKESGEQLVAEGKVEFVGEE